MQGPQTHDLTLERSHVLDTLAKHRLTVLNSWGKRSPTYLHPSGNSQIDFVCARQHLADKQGKMAGPRNEGLAAWRSAGHVPVVRSIKASWRPWVRSPDTAVPQMGLKINEKDMLVQKLREELRAHCPGRERGPKLPLLTPIDQHIDPHWRLRKKLRQLGNGVNMVRMAFEATRLATAFGPTRT